LPLRPIGEDEELPRKPRSLRPRCLFNEETELSNETVSRQVKAALGIDGFGATFETLKKRVSLMIVPTKTSYYKNLKGLKFIENAGRKTAGSLLIFQNGIPSNLKNLSEVQRLAEGSNSLIDSRTIASTSLISENISGVNETENIQPLDIVQPVETEIMETVVDQDILLNFPEDTGYPMDEDVLRQDMVLFSAKLPPPKRQKERSNTAANDQFILGALKGGRTKFSEIFPPSKCTRLQAAQGLMLLLRMQGEKKVAMEQHSPENDCGYGPISVTLLNV